MAAAATSAAGKTPLTVENVQEVVVKVLATHAPAAAAFAGMHEFERGNGFGLGEHTAFREITESATADEASPRGVGTGKKSDNGQRRGPSRPAQILNWIERISVAVGLLSIIVAMVAVWGETMGEIGQEAVGTLKNVASTAFTYALACGKMVKEIQVIFVVGLQPAAAYSVAGIWHRAHTPVIYSAMHLGARTKLDPAVWAPVESSFGGEHNGSQSAKWAWGKVRGHASDVMQQTAGRAPLGTTSFR